MEDGRMTFTEHLEELRDRIVRAGASVVLGMIVAWNFREQLHGWLLRPLEVAWFCRARQGCTTRGVFEWMLHPDRFVHAREAAMATLRAGANSFPVVPDVSFLSPTAAFTSYLRLAAIGGFVLALPVVFYQLWSFIAPGLYAREKRLVLPFVFFATAFFVSGALFGYHFVFPVAYEWFLGFAGQVKGTGVIVRPNITMDEYLDFSSQMLLAFGVVFLVPIFIFFLSLAGLVTGKQLLKFGRYFTVIAFIVAAILTPTPDVYSQVMLALPLVLLYFVAVALAFVFGPKEAHKFRSGPADEAEPAKALAKPAAKPDAKLSDAEREKLDAVRQEKLRRWEAEQEERRAAKIRAAKIQAAKANDPRGD